MSAAVQGARSRAQGRAWALAAAGGAVLAVGVLGGLPQEAAANADVQRLASNPKNWAMQAGDFYNQRYSRLDQINRSNVGKMQVAWTFSTGVLRGHEGSPLVIDGTMYLHSPFPNKVFAIDLDTQKIKWKYEPKQDPAVIPQMCCDTVNRGLAYAEGKVFLQREKRRPEAGRGQHQRAARVQGQGDHGDLGRRVGRARLFGRLRRGHGPPGVEGVQHGARCGNAHRPGQDHDVDRRADGARGARQLAQDVEGRSVENGRRHDLGLVQL